MGDLPLQTFRCAICSGVYYVEPKSGDRTDCAHLAKEKDDVDLARALVEVKPVKK